MTAPAGLPQLTDSDHRDKVAHLVCFCRPTVALCGWHVKGGTAVPRNPCATCVQLYRDLVPCVFCGCHRLRICRACQATGVR